jgi:hypothetical protein
MAYKTTKRVDKYLTNLSLGLTFEGMYVNKMVMPSIPVIQDSGKIVAYDKSHLRRNNTRVSNKGSVAPMFEHGFDTDVTYSTKAYAIEALITQHDLTQHDNPVSAERDIMKALTELMEVDAEYRAATLLLNTSTFTSATLSGTSQWSDYTNSDPLANITTAVVAVRDALGRKPNIICLDWEPALKLVAHPDIKESQLVGSGPLQRAKIQSVLSDWFGLKFVVGEAMYNSALEGATATLAATWGDDVFIGYINPNPGLYSQTCAATFDLKPGRVVRKYPYDKAPNAYFVQIWDFGKDEKVIDSNGGYVIENVIA